MAGEGIHNLGNFYGRDMRGSNVLQVIAWQSATWAAQAIGISLNQYPLTLEEPHKPNGLPPLLSHGYDEHYQEYFLWQCAMTTEYWNSMGVGTSDAA